MRSSVLAILLILVANVASAQITNEAEANTPALRPNHIKPGDKILIHVTGRPDLTVQMLVPNDGLLTLPGAGSVKAVGKTATELSEVIAAQLQTKARLVNPHVSVAIITYGSRTIYVYGDVITSRSVNLPDTRPLTASQAIAICGGFTANADRRKVLITHDIGTQAAKISVVDIQRIAEGLDIKIDPILKEGDAIYVPAREPIYVLGQVESPGAMSLPYGYPLTASKAVTKAGGWTRYAKYTKVRITRRTEDGIKVLHVNLDAVLNGKLDEDIELISGDTVYVPQRMF